MPAAFGQERVVGHREGSPDRHPPRCEDMNGLDSDAADLAVTTDRGVATLWLNRPAKRNAITYEMWVGIAEHCHQLARDPTVRLLVVRGVGNHFCAGADVAGLR